MGRRIRAGGSGKWKGSEKTIVDFAAVRIWGVPGDLRNLMAFATAKQEAGRAVSNIDLSPRPSALALRSRPAGPASLLSTAWTAQNRSNLSLCSKFVKVKKMLSNVAGSHRTYTH